MEEAARLSELCARVAAQRLPRWRELPDLELYMDQVLSLIDRYLASYPGYDRRGLTAPMVNNYVKLGVMPPPMKKKYTRIHLAHLIEICVLKVSLPIDAIRRLIAASLAGRDEETVYDAFCERFEEAVNAAADDARARIERSGEEASALPSAFGAALRAQADQALALELCEALLGEGG